MIHYKFKLLTALLSASALLVSGCSQASAPAAEDKQSGTETATAAVAQPEPVEPFPASLAGLPQRDAAAPFQGTEGKLVLRSVGDTLIHEHVSELAAVDSPIYRDAVARLQEEGIINEDYSGVVGGEGAYDPGATLSPDYDFMPMMARMAPFTSYADVTVANLETVAAYPEFPVSGYPQFNAPASILNGLKHLGVDLVTNGTNHTLDLFGEGAYESIENIKAAGLEYSGSYESFEDAQTPRIFEANGIELGFLTYTYGTNGIPVPPGEEHLINYIDVDKMQQDVAALKPQVDAVVVTLQIGPEYETMPDANQEYVFKILSDAGVKLILGAHPHVLQPVKWFNDGETYAIFSQASFMSGQYNADNKQGGITEVTFQRDETGEVQVTNPKFMPIYVNGEKGVSSYETVPMADYEKFGLPDGDFWWQTIDQRMQAITTDFDYVSHLETAWTEEGTDIHR